MLDSVADAVEAGPLKPAAPQRALGRVYLPNPGASRYAIRATQPQHLRNPRQWKTKHWRMGYDRSTRRRLTWQDQGYTSTCVRYGNTHILQLEPIVRVNAFDLTADLYPWAQRNDYWPGEEPTYYGTSVDAGLQYLLHVAKAIREYRWIFSMDDLLTRLSARAAEGGGPVVVGTDWYSGMDNLDGSGVWTVTGRYRGGHCYVIRGHDSPTTKREGRFDTGNSHAGNFEASISYDAMEWLLFGANGEAAAITELPRAA